MTGSKIALNVRENLPNLWKEGALFAFSGYDGQTDSYSQFVATVGEGTYSLLFHTPQRRRLQFLVPHAGVVQIATGDVLVTESEESPLLAVYQSWHTLIGNAPSSVDIVLSFEEEDGGKAWADDSLFITESANGQDVIVLLRVKERWALSYGRQREEAVSRVVKGLSYDSLEEIEARLQYYQLAPRLHDPMKERLLFKCFSVMKVNTLASEGVIRQHWSTPDRVPHKAMWLWDSVFHSLAMNLLNPELSWHFLKSVLDTQRDDGMIPHTYKVDGSGSGITQPPILAWGVWENYRHTKQSSHLRYALPILERYVNWDITHRDRNGNGLLEWMIEGNPLCRSGESGMDNSPRFDQAAVLDAVDFSVFVAQDAYFIGLIADELGETELAQYWQRKAFDMTSQIQDLLWDEREGFYFDRDMDGNFTRVKAVSGFLPLLLHTIPQERTDKLISMLQDTQHFQTKFPIPTTAASEKTYSTDMWRGPVWMNMNYLVYIGLKRQGRNEEADKLAQQSIEMVQKYYEQFGVIFEYFDSADDVPPVACDRKGPHRGNYNIRQKMDVVRDFHWSAALTACLLMEQA
ncbi:MGH1-like glycoside hydrolase domain-containing protein [Paenibacillus qinlingensis]|uniref:Glycogen debranching enzyme n=1 Tax=Paenibacillus qinlingensis TaxID=1837343 RepID=A0ABU1NS37_9BACL|nr:trehalase family glycosidase [Paenibacillus qinlingensis]MDR6550293.1 glycogen debranching enzyme [Paenibacillus qinlingensis]